VVILIEATFSLDNQNIFPHFQKATGNDLVDCLLNNSINTILFNSIFGVDVDVTC
jgi:hypothetical protein